MSKLEHKADRGSHRHAFQRGPDIGNGLILVRSTQKVTLRPF